MMRFAPQSRGVAPAQAAGSSAAIVGAADVCAKEKKSVQTATPILLVLLVIDCLALLGLILIQRGKGGGLAGVFGGGGVEQAFGTHAATLAQKATVVLAVIFLALTIILTKYPPGPTMPARSPRSGQKEKEKTSDEAPRGTPSPESDSSHTGTPASATDTKPEK